MRRREFITLLGGAAARGRSRRGRSRPSAMRRIGVLLHRSRRRCGMIRPASRRSMQGLAAIGLDHRPQRADRLSAGPRPIPTDIRRHAAELAALAPDVILTHGTPTLGPLLQATRTVPIVFATVADPVGAGFVDSLARPGGNVTGFMLFEYSLGRKMAGAAQGDRAGRDASGGPSGSRHCVRARLSSASSRPWRRRSGWR